MSLINHRTSFLLHFLKHCRPSFRESIATDILTAIVYVTILLLVGMWRDLSSCVGVLVLIKTKNKTKKQTNMKLYFEFAGYTNYCIN